MAVMKNTGDRRAFLAAGMGTIVAVGVAPAAFATTIAPNGSRAAWDAAMAEYDRTQKAMYAEEGDEAGYRFIDAEKAILDTRTPDMKALQWKLERLREISEHSVIEIKDFDHLLGDVAHLMGAMS